MTTENLMWKFLIIDLFDGSVLGTNNEKYAKQMADNNDECFVIDRENCKHIRPDLEVAEIQERVPVFGTLLSLTNMFRKKNKS